MKNNLSLLLTGFFLIAMISLAIGQSDSGKSQTEIDQAESDSVTADEADHEDENTVSGPHDPFHLPRKKNLNHQIPGGVRVGQWHLTGIIVGGSGERLAIVNDRLVSEGDKVTGGQIDRIYPDVVVIKGPFGTRELKMLSFSSESQGD
ncbi:MAG: hypothetical protein HY200_05260 [Nitrospirae bacterium]|nr:hypothetical protein [Nitrospirota bacterium]MBI3594348.1 hypothetical protein [Nitrospirota bacterium]